jgi:TolA-binding protein
MKRQFFALLIAGAVCVSLATGALAGSPHGDFEKGKLVLKLEERDRQLEQRAQATKGAPRMELEMQRRQVRNLIEKIKAGESVDPQEIDVLLGKRP